MTEFVRATLRLYQETLRATGRSFVHGWIIAVAVVGFAGLMVLALFIAAPLGLAGGFLLGAVNALLIGAMLNLIEQGLSGTRRIRFEDIVGSFGHYFWDVIGVGFVLWIPVMVLERAMAGHPNGYVIVTAIFFLLFVILNPAPEVIYQVRHDSPLDVIRRCYEFILDNWFEWFLPLAIVLAPFGLQFFFDISSGLGRMGGLDFFRLLTFPFAVLSSWLGYLGLPDRVASLIVFLLTPPALVLMLLFRGHLFAALNGSSRRQRLFQARMEL
ncbi:MAG: hypothetical protein ACREI3_08345 [Nitrospirales bacterium]